VDETPEKALGSGEEKYVENTLGEIELRATGTGSFFRRFSSISLSRLQTPKKSVTTLFARISLTRAGASSLMSFSMSTRNSCWRFSTKAGFGRKKVPFFVKAGT